MKLKCLGILTLHKFFKFRKFYGMRFDQICNFKVIFGLSIRTGSLIYV